jgi:histidyl-tRNA synthetase
MTKKERLQTPTGMHDILPEEQLYRRRINEVVEKIADFYNFKRIDTPILEYADVFAKGVGLDTDIIQKEMFTFKTKGDDVLSLRPEGTSPIVRAYLEQGMFNMPQPVKLWYSGPFFRYEKPQAGRYRQFWQFGLEVLGEASAVVDAQVIQIFYNILKDLKLKNLMVEINSIGDSQCRPYYKKLLKNYLHSREGSLCTYCRNRLKTNPLRVLDCKEEKCQRIVSQAPQTIDHLCGECKQHFKDVLEFLDEAEIPYRLNPYLVRGLDYYTKTVFEIVEQSPSGESLGTLIGGGRYDGLAKILGGRNIPAMGGAAGIERVIAVMKEQGIDFSKDVPPKVFLSQIGKMAKIKSIKLFEDFRKANISIVESLGRDSLRSQIAKADKLGVAYSLILGQRETLEGTIIIRDMQTGKQTVVKLDEVVDKIKKLLTK